MSLQLDQPAWAHCTDRSGGDAGPACRGVQVGNLSHCLAHASEEEQRSYFSSLSPGSAVDHRGTTFTTGLLKALLDALRNEAGRATFGTADFTEAQFAGDARFVEATFNRTANFDNARFDGDVTFIKAKFVDATFRGTHFTASADFLAAQFSAEANFDQSFFGSHTSINQVEFRARASFNRAHFKNSATFTWSQFGGANFGRVQFDMDANFGNASFNGACDFSQAEFRAASRFSLATFAGHPKLEKVDFNGLADFRSTTFRGYTSFNECHFAADANFNQARFVNDATFRNVSFDASSQFKASIFGADVVFLGARFASSHHLGPLACQRNVVLNEAAFSESITVEISAANVDTKRTVWQSTAALRLRYATVDMTDAVLSAPIVVTTHSNPFVGINPSDRVDEGNLSNLQQVTAQVRSIAGVDGTHLVFSDVDLSKCAFVGAFHLDQIRLEGNIHFARPPGEWRYRNLLPNHWSSRRVIAEECRWRANTDRHGSDWRRDAQDSGDQPNLGTVGPGALAVIYRALRKALEDRGDAPGAADFYYGEMDMRRHAQSTARPERRLLWAYWLLSGYGLRASRAAVSLLLTMAATIFLLILFGIPGPSQNPSTVGSILTNGQVTLRSVDVSATLPPWNARLTSARTAESIPVVLDAVIFRTTDTDLTSTGNYIDMAARLLEPSLVALAVLAIRGRVKR
jgi:hypothetical protein